MLTATERRFRLRLGLIALAALAGRVVYLVAAKRDQPLLGDAVWYSAQARVLADGHGFVHPFVGGPSADHPPLTPLLVAPADWIAPGSVMGQRVVVMLAGVGTVVLLGLLARRLAGDRAGLLAAGIVALYANFWMNDGVVMSESFAALALVATLLVAYRAMARPGPGVFAALGALVALCALTRAELVLLAPLVVLPLAWRLDAPARRRAGLLGVAAAATLATLAPWWIYNASRFTEPVWFSTNDGVLIAGCYCDDVFYGGGLGFWSLRCAEAVPIPPGADQSEASRLQRAAGVDYARDHLGRLPVVVAARLGRVWSLYDIDGMAWLNQGEGRERWASLLGVAQFWVLVPAAVGGFVVLRRRRVPTWPLVAQVVLVTGVAALSYGIVRLRLPAEVTLVVLAAAGLDAAWSRLEVRGRTPA